MNDLLTRAAAIRHLVLDSQDSTTVQPLVEAVAACCEDLVRAGEGTVAIELAATAEALAGTAGPDSLLRLSLIRIRALLVRGSYEEAMYLSRLLAEKNLPVLDSRSRESIEIRLLEASSLWRLNRAGHALERLSAIRKELLSLPDSILLARCALEMSSASMRLGEFQSARRFALESIVSSRRAGDSFYESIALNNFGQIERTCARWDAAEEACAEALRLSEAEGHRYLVNNHRRSLAIVLWKRGKLETADGMADRCIRDSAALSAGSSEWYSFLLKGMIAVHKGRFAEASQQFSRNAGWDVPRAESRPSLLTTEFLGDIHLEQSQAEPALKHYDEVWPKALALVPKGDIVAELRRRRAECYLLLGRSQEAYDEAKVGLDHCRELGDRYEEAATYRVLALAAAALGNAGEAKRWFDQGFAYYDDIETPYEWGKLWLAYGDWVSGPNAGEFADPMGAREAYLAARDHFERMGAEAKLAEAKARLARFAPAPVTMPAQAMQELDRPRRRPRGSAELDRRSEWARETFGFVTRNKMVLDLLTEVSKLASAGSSLLILGESGTGKELIARGVHKLSRRAGAFVPINCAALPREVIESELFGHVQGAFTGAHREKAGLLEVCDGGTVFLDEIAEMSIELQSRLLRFLETGEIRRVGANKTIVVDTLVVAATNRERALLEKGEGFRPDLYYRLAHAVVVLPPLRRRGDDVDLLVGHFLEDACVEQGKQIALSVGARNRLNAFPWPGNVRQLRAVLRRLAILSPAGHEVAAEEVLLDDLDVASSLSEELEQAERRRMVEALAQAAGSRSEAARALGMARTTFVTKMKRYGIR